MIIKKKNLIIFILICLILYINRKTIIEKFSNDVSKKFVSYFVLKNFNSYIDFINENNMIIEIPNIYLEDKSKLKWIDAKKDLFTQYNRPNNLDHDYKIKKDILEQSFKLNNNEAIIDCGAHIGDLTIPLAHALKIKNRNDITIYALDPSPEKCKYIQLLANINKLTNVKVICSGLNSKNSKLYPQKHIFHLATHNSGATTWTEKKDNNNSSVRISEPRIFNTLDHLIDSKQINHIVKIIHLDVEGYEKEVIKGSYNTLRNYKPYISLETHNDERKSFEKLLQNNYKFIKRTNQNNVFSSKS